MIALLFAAAALAETITSTGLPQYVNDIQASNGCVVLVATQRDSADAARQVLGLDVAVRAVAPEKWEAFLADPGVSGRCVLAITSVGSGRWDANVIEIARLPTESTAPSGPSAPPRKAGAILLQLGAGTVGAGVGALIGDRTGYALFRSRYLKYDQEAPRRTLAQAWGAGVGAATFGAAAVWGVGGIGDKHGSPVWTLVGAGAGIGLGAAVIAASDHDGAINNIGTAIELVGAPIGAVIGLNASLRWDEGAATLGCIPDRTGVRCTVAAAF